MASLRMACEVVLTHVNTYMWTYTHINQCTCIVHTLEKHGHTSEGNTPTLGAEEEKKSGTFHTSKAVKFLLPQKPHGT